MAMFALIVDTFELKANMKLKDTTLNNFPFFNMTLMVERRVRLLD
ncbi:protein of unknown function [Methylotuvimicrobium alcaliphilum 20Z]|uniref:Uncharacterized protein n=1 Tax=Methylotuvimicrobium alcaliphilum (strain DSM 19304 / NCIMB 14124 / VKM B-2133 / 20Z) TaxID=1091494 RepID=G4STX8_META2|nr:protein of unknown function [Methylotuvimicrobium alcaliphilum 20Z]